MGMEKPFSLLVHPINQSIGIGWPFPTILLIICLMCSQCLADGTHKFSLGEGQNEVARRRAFDGDQTAKNGQQQHIASSVASNWEGSGATPDDEDGDVDEEGSGDGMSAEGSGSPPEEQKSDQQKSVTPITTDTQHQKQYPNSTLTVAGDDTARSLSPVFGPFPTRAIGAVVTTTTTTVLLATTLKPPLFKPSATTSSTTATSSTPLSSSVSRSSSPNATTTTTAWPRGVKPTNEEDRWPQPPPPKGTSSPFTPPTRTSKRPFFISDPSGTLEQLRPGIFAFMVGGFVVALLLLILIISYLVYRLKKRDEGTYICEEPHQPAHYPYAYQKASIREFYA